MRKYLLLVLLVSLFLTACQPQADVANSNVENEENASAQTENSSEAEEEADVEESEEEVASVEESETTDETSEEGETEVSSNQPYTNASCTPFKLFDSILSTPATGLAPLDDADWVMGPEDAVITIIEYSEPQCPYCAMLEPQLQQLYEDFPGDVRLVYRHFPLKTIHDKAMIASQSMEAAGQQGNDKFFEMKEVVFTNRDNWVDLSVEEYIDWAIEKAGEIGLDVEQFTEDLQSEAVIANVDKDFEEGYAAGVGGTPTVFINGMIYEGQRSYDILAALIELAKLEEIQYGECPPSVIDISNTYTATIETTKGDIVIELYDDIAPVTVNSFVFLSEEGWFNGLEFFRVVDGFVAQTGDPTNKGYGGPGYIFGNEVHPDYTFDEPGVVGMARANSDPDSYGSQFFITFDAQPDLNGNYTIFGKVIEGMDVLESLNKIDPSLEEEQEPGDTILNITIEEK